MATTINPVETTTAQAPAFRGGKKNLLEKLMPQAKKLTKEQAILEQTAGMTCAATTADKAVLSEIVRRETMLGHMDFVKGINEYLAKDAAKNVYKK